MRQSELFTKTQKNSPKDETAVNAQLLTRAGYVDKVMAGVYSLLPLGIKVIAKIAGIIREEINAVGGQEVSLPVLHPKENWEITGRWQKLDVLFKIKSREGKEMALGPTHEEIIVPLAKKFISSYQDLPVALYQIQTKFRDEERAKSGLLRGREFLMKDLYSFHADRDDLEKYYEQVKGAYQKIFKRLDLDALVVEASGGTFSKLSHEFQVITSAGEDVIFHCGCGFARNKEIFEGAAGSECPNCGKPVREDKAVEIGNIFNLGTKFSESFSLNYRDNGGNERPVIMGCYGIGLSRLMGTIVETHYDERGIRWPQSVAPYIIHLVALGGKKSAAVAKVAEKLYALWQKSGLLVLYDDRDLSAGEKLGDADLIGLPYRVVVSERTGAKVELKQRDQEAVKLVSASEIMKQFAKKT